jgi:hypothetical protein
LTNATALDKENKKAPYISFLGWGLVGGIERYTGPIILIEFIKV